MARTKLKGFDEVLLEVRKVTKVTRGGRRMRFRAMMLVGDRAGHIGLGLATGNDVSAAIQKASHNAYKNIYKVSITKDGTTPYKVDTRFKASHVVLRPAGPGTGLVAGSSVRSVLELAGYENILSKIIGSSNKLNNALATIKAITSFKVNVAHIQEVKEVEEEVIEDKKKNKKRSSAKRSPQRSSSRAPRKTTAIPTPDAAPASENDSSGDTSK